MLLSRAAEHVYWAGRYLERAESSARVIKVHTELFLDLPRSAGMGWAPLLAITGSMEQFDELHETADEDSVVTFLLGEERNPGSIVSALDRARENIRATRTVFPREAWEIISDLHVRSGATRGGVVNRWARIAWLDQVIATSHRLRGLLEGTMCRDAASGFLRIGQLVERADMSTRVLDVQAGSLLTSSGSLEPYADVTWMAVLKSLAGYETYRRRASHSIGGDDVLRFVLQDPVFPRSIEHCLIEISQHLLEFRDHEATMTTCAATQTLIEDTKVKALDTAGLHDYVDDLQGRITDPHEPLERTYFPQPTVSAQISSQLATA